VPQKVTELLAGLGIGAYGVVQDVSFAAIFKGVLPFITTDILRLVIPIAFPIIALWLPGRM
jgi:TRAP-type C4-dicarboxylate transport system permease large subunit